MKFWPTTANLHVKVILIDTHIGYSTTKLKLPYFDLSAIFKVILDCLIVWNSDFWHLILISNIITHHNPLIHIWKLWFSFLPWLLAYFSIFGQFLVLIKESISINNNKTELFLTKTDFIPWIVRHQTFRGKYKNFHSSC